MTTMLARRVFLGGIGCMLLSSARAAEVIRVIVPYAAGGITDIGARVICEQLGTVLGQPVIVENRPGGGTRIGTSAAKPN
jgi:tripartite-type tricarboxylate transporter receptor subunit TctC